MPASHPGAEPFDADLKPMISSLPSYTQLGMAALLPHSTLELAADGNGTVLADGANTVGLQAREKRLAAGRVGDRAKTISAGGYYGNAHG